MPSVSLEPDDQPVKGTFTRRWLRGGHHDEPIKLEKLEKSPAMRMHTGEAPPDLLGYVKLLSTTGKVWLRNIDPDGYPVLQSDVLALYDAADGKVLCLRVTKIRDNTGLFEAEVLVGALYQKPL